LPDVCRAENLENIEASGRQTRYMPEFDEIHSCPSEFKPSKEWATKILADFSTIRTVKRIIQDSLHQLLL